MAQQGLQPGAAFPQDVVFKHCPAGSGAPRSHKVADEWKGKTVVLVSAPGAFTPTCHGVHIPPFIEKLPQLRDKGVDIVAVIATNDAFVMKAWAQSHGVNNDEALFMSDTGTKLGEKIGWMAAPGADRNARFVVIVDKDGKIKYAALEDSPKDVTGSGVDAVLEKL